MASKRFYSKTVKGSMTEGKNLQEVYEELNGMSDADREARISEIEAEIEEIAKLMLNRQMNSSTNAEKTQSLIGRVEKLKKEQKMLELFPKVKKKLKKIAQLYRRAKKEKTRKQDLAQGKYMSLRAELRRKEVANYLNCSIATLRSGISHRYKKLQRKYIVLSLYKE